jgi:hypothetical protein
MCLLSAGSISLDSTFKDSAPSYTVIGNWHSLTKCALCSKEHTTLTEPLVLHRTRFDKCAMKKFGINGQLQNKFFLIITHRFSLVKAAMVLAKRPQFVLFSTAKGGTKTIGHL